ncbi:MAG: calcium-translocating P-type ATPase, PMCA-type [Deltaproteobacteria bacterium]|nr:MAG: calcium-translocating P-type ATPase, PMCA-type [Deltaproteobacteria bacterium]
METMQSGSEKMRFKGLNAAQVEASRKQHGANIVTPPERDPWWKLYLEKFNDPIIRILVIAAIIAIGIGIVDGTYFEGIGIVVAIFLATYLGFLNEYQAAKEFEVLSRTNDEYQIQVIRDSIYTSVPKKDLVVGDLVLIEVGSEVPADGRLLEAVSLQVDEASLTGESAAVTKVSVDKAPPAKEEETTYPRYQLLRGSMVADGRGVMEVTAVGDSTEIGQIAQELGGEDKVETPLNLQLDRLSKLIGVLAFIIAVMIIAALVGRGIITKELSLSTQQWVFVVILTISVIILLVRVWLPMVYDGLELIGSDTQPPEWLQNEDLKGWVKTTVLGLAIFTACVGIGYLLKVIPASPRDWLPAAVGHEFLTYFMIAMTVIVVAVPEGLPMSVTLSLAYSMRKMMATNNLVRRMHACETIGAATVICSDKTGTLTMNEMRVFAVDFPALPEGKLDKNPKTLGEQLVLESMAANSTANLCRIPGEPACPLGNPTECSLLLWLDALGIDYMYHRTNLGLQYQWTFSTERKFMGTIGQSAFTGTNILYIKGAPEIVLDRCTKVLTPGGVNPVAGFRSGIETALINFQQRGMRTLGFAYHEDPVSHEGKRLREIATGLTWLGFVAISDPLRKEVPAAISACQDAGISVKMITGDNPKTAQEISRQLGLWKEHDAADSHMTGDQFEQLEEDRVGDVVQTVKIFSRARPRHKLQIVKTLQELGGEVVAVTGDGVNDVSALKQAHVGLAMGKAGTDAAKEASDIILLDDSFTSIANAVKWGRSLYENIQRFILFQLTINVAACFIALLGPFIGVKLPLTVTQMLWVNLIMDTFAALALATEPPHDSVMKQPPRDSQAFIISRSMAINIFTVGFIFLIFLVGFLLFIQKDGQPTIYQLTTFFTVFVMLNFWNLFNARCLGRTHSACAGIFQNKGFIIIASAIFIGQVLMVQFGGSFFRTVPLSLKDWVIIIGGTSVVLWIGEMVRLVRRFKSA